MTKTNALLLSLLACLVLSAAVPPSMTRPHTRVPQWKTLVLDPGQPVPLGWEPFSSYVIPHQGGYGGTPYIVCRRLQP